MAGTRFVTSAFTTAFSAMKMQKPLKLSSISASSAKPSKRRNYLRLKIPKTTIPLPVEPQSDPKFAIVSDSSTGEFTEALEHQVSDMVAVGEHGGDGVGLISTRSVFSVCLCLFAAILIHIFHGVWFLRKNVSESEQKDKLETGIQETNAALKPLFNGNELEEKIQDIVNRGGSSGTLDEAKLKANVSEIRKMAREIRRGEGSQLGRNVGNGDDDKVIENDRSEIEKQIGWRLARVQRKSQKLLKIEDDKICNDLDLKELSRKIIFKKRGLKVKRPSTEPRSKPKGFKSSENDDTGKEKSDLGVIDASVDSVCNDGVQLLDGENRVQL